MPADPRLEALASVLDQLACPACSGKLEMRGESLACAGCGRLYPVVDGIPVLIQEPMGSDATRPKPQ